MSRLQSIQAGAEAGGGPRAGSFDNIVFDDTAADAAAVVAGLRGKTLVGVHRKGKQLWLELSSPPHLLGHFGMTGAFVVRGVAAARYKSFKVEEESWPPRFTKLELVLDGARVAFCDPRRLGRLVGRDAVHEHVPQPAELVQPLLPGRLGTLPRLPLRFDLAVVLVDLVAIGHVADPRRHVEGGSVARVGGSSRVERARRMAAPVPVLCGAHRFGVCRTNPAVPRRLMSGQDPCFFGVYSHPPALCFGLHLTTYLPLD